MKKSLMSFGNQLKFLREQRGWTQEQTAVVLEVSKSAVEKWEAESKTPLLVTQEGVIARMQDMKRKPSL